jgi:hypothetical protein
LNLVLRLVYAAIAKAGLVSWLALVPIYAPPLLLLLVLVLALIPEERPLHGSRED